MTAFARVSRSASSDRRLPTSSTVRGVGPVLALLCILAAGSCSQGQNAPFVQLSLNNLPASVVRLVARKSTP